MSIVTTVASSSALYPPTVVPPVKPLPVWRFLPTFVRNPLRSIPQASYEEDMIVVAPRPGVTIVWVSKPALVEQILVGDADKMTKSPVEKRVFQGLPGR